MKLKIWTDGGCSPNPGKGAWAFRIETINGKIIEDSGSVENSTNNRMETLAVVNALKQTQEFDSIDLYTDSVYVQRAIHGMKKPTINFDLLDEIEDLVSKRKLISVYLVAFDDNERVHKLVQRYFRR